MSEPVAPQRPLSAGPLSADALPPVEPPSAGFIIQLFVIPGIIVFIIVMVWLMFNWLAQKGNDPSAYIRDLSKNNANRWQAAVNLTNALRGDRDTGPDSLKNNADLARQLVGILEPEIKAGSTAEDSIRLRVFLCSALGEFHVNTGLPALLKAAETNREPAENEVRRAALQSIALLAEFAPPPDAELEPRRREVLLAASRDQDNQVRSTAAFALGIVKGDEMLARLREMLTDPYPDSRFNAATGLARHGDAACVEVLCEMLDPDELAGVKAEEEPGARDYKRAMIIINALARAGNSLPKMPEPIRRRSMRSKPPQPACRRRHSASRSGPIRLESNWQSCWTISSRSRRSEDGDVAPAVVVGRRSTFWACGCFDSMTNLWERDGIPQSFVGRRRTSRLWLVWMDCGNSVIIEP